MARGWESKSVESQQDQQPIEKKSRPTVEDQERGAKRSSLELSRTRVLRELETASSPVHRSALENALKFLDDEIAKLGEVR